jgi:dUTP pyrophosphatase
MSTYEKSGDYLFISNVETEMEFGDFPDYDLKISGTGEKTFLERFLNLFVKEYETTIQLRFDDKELDKISNVMRKLYMKKLQKSENLTFNVEKTIGSAIIPTKAHPSDTGFDLYSPFEFALLPNEAKLINFHIKIQLEEGYEAQVRNRSGIVSNFHCNIPIGVGSIDCHYRGEIKAPIHNFGQHQQIFKAGSRMAQLVIKKTEPVYIQEGKVYNNTERGSGGFGSTGV